MKNGLSSLVARKKVSYELRHPLRIGEKIPFWFDFPFCKVSEFDLIRL